MAQRTCEIDGCERPWFCRHWCHRHYTRWRATGDPGPARIRSRWATEGMCTFPGCTQRHEAHGFCPGHRNQYMTGRPLAELEPRLKTTDRDELGRKRCNACLEWLPVEQFTNNKTPADGLSTSCKTCHRRRGLLKRYGLTLDQFDELLGQHAGLCAICRAPNPSGRPLSVDHDHRCCPDRHSGCDKCVRGLLCNTCNMGIGYLGDSPDLMRRAAEYLLGGWRAVIDV